MGVWSDIAIAAGALFAGYFVLHRRFIRPMRRQFKKLTEMQAGLVTLFSQLEDMMDAFEEYAEEVRTDIKRSKDAISGYAKVTSEQRELTVEARRDFEQAVEQCRQDAAALRRDLNHLAELRSELIQERSRSEKMESAFRMPGDALPPREETRRRPVEANPRRVRVLTLAEEGHSMAQIAQITGFSRGEIELIMQIKPTARE